MTALKDLLHVAARRLEQLLPRIEPREPQQVLDQPLHARRVPRDDLEELPRAVGVGRLVEQRLDVAADRRERRAQLVRHVGDEVAPDLIGAPQIGDVVQHEHGAAAAGPETGAARATNVRPGSRASASSWLSTSSPRSAAVSCAAMSGCRITSRYGRPAADGVDAQHLLRGAIDQLQPSLPIDDEHALDHAGEDRFHARAIARQLLEPAAELLDRRIEHPRHRAELVAAVVVRRARRDRRRDSARPRARSR